METQCMCHSNSFIPNAWYRNNFKNINQNLLHLFHSGHKQAVIPVIPSNFLASNFNISVGLVGKFFANHHDGHFVITPTDIFNNSFMLREMKALLFGYQAWLVNGANLEVPC